MRDWSRPLIVAWVLFPIVALAICVGCGLAVERVAGVRIPGTIVPSVGLALVIVAATLTTYKSATAKFTTALVIVLAVAGYASSTARLRRLRPQRFALGTGLLLYVVLAAPVVFSGKATFLGYFQLNDSAVHFALIDQLLKHGRDLGSVHSSSLRYVLNLYFSTDYPVGAQAALGAFRPLTGQDVAWVFQPYLALILSLGGVALYELLAGVVASRPLRALCAFVAAQPSLVYAYYLQASIKELATAWLITLAVVLVIGTLKARITVRRLAPLAIVTIAAFDVLGTAIVPWLGVPLGVFAALALWRTRHVMARVPRRRLALVSGAFVLALALLASPIIATARRSFDVLSEQLTKHGDLGNLPGPLSKWELLGIWPSGDFRIKVSAYAYQIPHGALVAGALIAVAVASAVLGTVWAIRRRLAAPLLLLAGSGLAAIYLLGRASPYAAAKVMMIVSVAIATMVMLGAVALRDLGSRLAGSARVAVLPGWALAAILAGGVLWSNVDAYSGAKLAPRAEYAELSSIGARFAGQGPAFYNLGDEFGLHFLGREVPTDTVFSQPLSLRDLPARAGEQQVFSPWDPNEVAEPYLQSYPLLVLARSPLSSRPPANFRRAYEGRFFEVWRRTAAPRLLEHLPLGIGRQPAAVPPCATVAALAKRASREGARLAVAARDTLVELPATTLRYVAGSRRGASREPSVVESALLLHGSGTLVGHMAVPSAGRYEVWLAGSFSREIEVRIDGRRAGADSYEIGPPGQLVSIGSLQLAGGPHALSIVLPDNTLAPGERSRRQLLASVILAPAAEPEPVEEVDPARARSLCGRSLDWIEIVR